MIAQIVDVVARIRGRREDARALFGVLGRILMRDPQLSNLIHLTSGSFFMRNGALGSYGEFSDLEIDGIGARVVRHICRTRWESETQPLIEFRGGVE